MGGILYLTNTGNKFKILSKLLASALSVELELAARGGVMGAAGQRKVSALYKTFTTNRCSLVLFFLYNSTRIKITLVILQLSRLNM